MQRRGIYTTPSILALAIASLLATGPALSQNLENVLVTARKRAENLQDVPLAISALTADSIEDLVVQDLTDISKISAGLLFDNEFGRDSNRPVIRGQANILGESGVSYFIDGVYITGSISDYNTNDIERIEIVKGPQSALYGRNTYSGAINIITKSPGDELSGRIEVNVADDDQTEYSASIRGPIIKDTLAGGLNLRMYEADGFFTNAFDGSPIGEQQSRSGSGVLVYTPNDRLELRARAYYNEQDDGQPALFHQSATENNCFNDDGALYGGGGRYFCGELQPGVVSTDYTIQAPNAREEVQSFNTSLVATYDINDEWEITSVTGFNDRDSVMITDGDYQPTSFQVANFTPNGFPFAGFPVPPFDYAYAGSIVDFTFASWTETEDISQEVRLAYSGDNYEALFGLYYFDQDSQSRSVRELPAAAAGIAGANFGAEFGRMQGVCAANPICGSIVPFFGPTIDVPSDIDTGDITNTAAFASVAFDLRDNMSLRLEGRYQREKVSQSIITETGATPIDSSKTFTNFAPRVTFDWDLNDDSMIYALAATGTKPGGFNSAVAIEAGLPVFDEEDVVSFEVGSKNRLADGQVTANFAFFFNQIDGYQLTQNARAGANTTSATVNAGDADIMGFETEIAARPAAIDGLTLTFNYAYIDSEFTRGRDENQGVLNDVADDGLVNCSLGDEFPDDPADPTGSCNESLFGSIVGNRIPRTAENQAFLDAELRRPWRGDWEWFAGANIAYESSKFAQVHNLIETGNTTLVNARFGLVNDRYRIMLWGKNINGEDSSPLALRYADADNSFRRSFVGTLRRDTYWGLTGSVSF